MECIYCKKQIKHRGHYPKCTERKRFINEILTFDFLSKEIQIKSANSIAKEVSEKYLCFSDNPLYASSIIDKCKSFGIKTHSISESCFLETVKIKKKITIQEKYGCDNISQNEEIKQKKINKALEKYGTINVFQSEEIKEKSRQTCLEKYGAISFSNSKFYKDPKRNFSKPHQKVSQYLNGKNIIHKNEVRGKFSKFNDELNKFYSPIPDIVLEDYKVILEINGDRWHCHPSIYKPEDKISHLWCGECFVKDVWKKDDIRKRHLESFGYKVVIIWELDLKKDFKTTIDKFINENCTNQKNNKIELLAE